MSEEIMKEPPPAQNGVQVTLQTVYLKDSSYESPNGPRLPGNQTWEPKFQLNMNTTAEDIGPDIREVLLTITLEAKQGETTLYLVEVKQAGVFPYAREVVSDLITKGGFPNFLLPLVNFDALYQQAADSGQPQTGAVN